MQQTKDGTLDTSFAIHQYYMDIINCMPNIVYWIDEDCMLKGCNSQFVTLLGIRTTGDFVGTPYEQLIKFANWSVERVEAFRLDDMAVMFSGKSTCNIPELPLHDKEGNVTYYLSTRVPLRNQQKQLIGLVVVLTDVTAYRQRDNSLYLDTVRDEVPSMRSDRSIVPRILMVEDNLIAQKVEQSLLTALNCQVDIAESGERALQLFVPGRYDVVFMDIGLQDTSGYVVAKKIREKEKNSGHYVPIIALTSYQANVVKDDCTDYLMDGVITKPLSAEQAKQLIEHYVYHEKTSVNGLVCSSPRATP